MILITVISFPYVRERGFYRPKIPIIISVDGHRTEVLGLIDSGSDFVLFPKEIAEAVGIDVKGKEKEAEGLGGKIRYRNGVATITLKKDNISKILRNMRIHIQTDNFADLDEIILGRDPFFKYFTIEFNENKKRIRLIPNRRSLKEPLDL